MTKERRLLDEATGFLSSIRPVEEPQELVKPFPDSALHESTVDELKQKLYEARSYQHTLVQFSEEEIKHFQFVDEATAIITYKQLDELNKRTLRNYIEKSAIDMQSQGIKQGAAVGGIVHSPTPEGKQAHSDASIKAGKTANKRFRGILKATRKLATEETEQLDELSTKSLKDYQEKAGEEVSSYKPGTKMSDINKRVQGYIKAGEKVVAKNAKTPERNESVDEVTEGYMKTIRRHFQGWGDTKEKPADIKKRVAGMSDASLAASKNTRTKMEPEPHTPEALQRKLVDRQFKSRNESHSDEAEDKKLIKKMVKKDALKEDSLDESRMPLKGHAYHTKSDDELRFIVKDAGEAAQAQKGMSSERKYLDQVNDASTILHYRKNGGAQIKKEALKEGFDRTGALNRIKNLLG